MISRVDFLPRFGSFIRQITKSSTLTKQITINKNEKVLGENDTKNSNETKRNFKKFERKQQKESAQEDLEQTSKDMKSLNKKLDSVKMNNLFQNFETKIFNESGFKRPEKFKPTTSFNLQDLDVIFFKNMFKKIFFVQ